MLTAGSRIGVCGAGAMGAGIAQIAAAAGHDVIVFDQDPAALARGKSAIAKGLAALVKRGTMTAPDAEIAERRVAWNGALDALRDVDLVIEAIIEDAAAKAALFRSLEAVIRSDAVIATNTSSLSVSELGKALDRPARFLGLHFFNPPPVMKLVEVVSGAATARRVAEAAFALMERWAKIPVHAKDAPGFIVNRVARPFYSEGWRALEEGAADAATIDFLFRDLAGFRMGPLELGDFIGHDVNAAAARGVFEALGGGTRFRPSTAQQRLVAEGRLGRKAGEGVYDYREGARKPEPAFVPSNASGASIGLGPMGSAAKDDPEGLAIVGDTLVRVSNGRSAAAVSRTMKRSVAVLDFVRDPEAATTIAFAVSGDEARRAALAYIGAAGRKAVEIRDRPGMIVLRTLAQLANAAADAVAEGVADADAIDKAMRYGANYPIGPIEWAREFGAGRVAGLLDAMADETGEEMYRANDALRSA